MSWLRFARSMPIGRVMNGPLTVEGPEQAPRAPSAGEPARGPATPMAEPGGADDLSDELDTLEEDLGFEISVVLARAAEIERAAEVRGEVALWHRARLLQADMWQRQ